MSVDLQQTTRRYIPEEDTLQSHRCENLKSYEEIIDGSVGFEVLTAVITKSSVFWDHSIASIFRVEQPTRRKKGEIAWLTLRP
jgi:hypothetical protein